MAEITIRFDPTNLLEIEAVRQFFDKQESLFFGSGKPGKMPVEDDSSRGEGMKFMSENLSPLGDAPSTAVAEPSTTVHEGPEDTSPVPTNDGDVDAAGTPWDERIHSGNRTKTAAGIWTRRRNVPDDVYHRVIAELRSVPVPPTPTAAPVPPPPVSAVPAPPQPEERPVVEAATGNPFIGLVKRVSEDVKAGKYSNDTVLGLIASLNRPELTNLGSFVSHHDAIPQLLALIDALE